MKRHALILAALCALALCTAAEAEKCPEPYRNIILVMDISGSMGDSIQGTKKLDMAKSAMTDFVNSLSDADLAIRLFPYKGDCSSAILAPFAPVDQKRQAFLDYIKNMNYGGSTPIETALKATAGDFPASGTNEVILVSDGEETCGGDPCKAIKSMVASGYKARVSTVGFAVSGKAVDDLKCIAQATGGSYYEAKNARGLKDALIAASKPARKRILLLADQSESMADRIGNETKIGIAKTAMAQFVETLSSADYLDLAIRIMPNGEECETELKLPFASVKGSKQNFLNYIRSMQPLPYYTPIEKALEASKGDFPKGGTNEIIMFSDGEETCGGDPCQAIKDAIASGFNVKVYTIGFDLPENAVGPMKCIADASGGTYAEARDLESLAKALVTVACPPTGRPAGAVCGDKRCYPGENCSSCPSDCLACPVVCGDGKCAKTETCSSCAKDCGVCPEACGDNKCTKSENCSTCPKDCRACPKPVCGDKKCAGETCSSCAKDCGNCTMAPRTVKPAEKPKDMTVLGITLIVSAVIAGIALVRIRKRKLKAKKAAGETKPKKAAQSKAAKKGRAK